GARCFGHGRALQSPGPARPRFAQCGAGNDGAAGPFDRLDPRAGHRHGLAQRRAAQRSAQPPMSDPKMASGLGGWKLSLLAGVVGVLLVAPGVSLYFNLRGGPAQTEAMVRIYIVER